MFKLHYYWKIPDQRGTNFVCNTVWGIITPAWSLFWTYPYFLFVFFSSLLKLLFIFSDSRNASWTYSCEYFRFPTIPSLPVIWREPLEPGVAPTSPDDWSSVQAKSPARVSICSSTHRLWGSYCTCEQRLMAYVQDTQTPKNMICCMVIRSVCQSGKATCHMYRICVGSCKQMIQMFHVLIVSPYRDTDLVCLS